MAFAQIFAPPHVEAGKVADVVQTVRKTLLDALPADVPFTVQSFVANDQIVENNGNPDVVLVVVRHEAQFSEEEEVKIAKAITAQHPHFSVLVTFIRSGPWSGEGQLI
jgi:hypothetical protein